MKQTVLIFFLTILMFLFYSGCFSVTTSEMYVNPHLDIKVCSSGGEGYSGLLQTNDAMAGCKKAMDFMGYTEISKAGVPGFLLNDSLMITKVYPNSSLEYYKIKKGDYLVAVNGKVVKSKSVAEDLMFGKVLSMLTITVNKGGVDSTYRVQRDAFSEFLFAQ